MIRTAMATRYVLPLREGSLPAIVEADDLGIYVAKFRGAGQGVRALVAELVAGEIGRALGLSVPEIVFIEFDAALGRNEPDAEIRQLLKAALASIWRSIICLARRPSIRRLGIVFRLKRHRWPYGSTLSRRTSIARLAMPTCSCGTANSI